MTAVNQKTKSEATPQLTQWYILRGEMKYGPYEYGIIIQMLQKGEVQDYNYVWAPHLSTWTLLGDVPDFAMDRLAGLIMNRDQKTHGFVIREFARVDHKIPLYGHNEHHFFDGESLSISENGALVLLNTPLLVPGSDLVMHFKTGKTEPFNVVAQVVRKNFSKSRINVKSGLHYAVRFLQVPERGLNTLKKLINENK
jgi:hypothetical protein